ncbi:MAG: hypothetical protein CHACPFDD_01533 [Phycisphaerae bacterium]|nr:hypothetical protein [Phycisphaerae bacterium]
MKPRAASPSRAIRSPLDACECVGCVLLLLILAIRPLASETFESIDVSFLAASTAGPTAASTAITDSAALLVSTLLLLRAAPRTSFARRTAALVALLAAAAAVSTAVADDRRVAANSAFSLLASVVAIVALPGPLRRHGLCELALAIALATGTAFAWKCIAQVGYEFAETQQAWEQQQQTSAAHRQEVGVDPERINFERRMRSREAFGYLSHANLAAGCLAMWLLAALGVLAALRASSRKPHAPLLAAIGLLLFFGAALWFTHSTGAFVATIAGGAALGACAAVRHAFERRRNTVVAAMAGCYIGLISLGAAWGLLRGTLPHSSLAFRWHYWTAAARAWLDAPLTGVGRANFAAAYLLHKPPESPEEVRDPHNLWVTALVELGPLGLLAIAGLALLWLFKSAPRPPPTAVRPDTVMIAPRDAPFPVASTLACIAAFAATHAALSRSELLAAGAVAWWAIEIVGTWTVGFVLARGLIRSATAPAAAFWLAAAAWAAGVAAFVHNLVDFSLLTPAGLGLAGVFMAVALARFGPPPSLRTTPLTPSDTPPPSPPRAVLSSVSAAAAALLLLATGLVTVVVPSLRSEAATDGLNTAIAQASLPAVDRAAVAARAALARDPWESAGLARLARIEAQVGAGAPDPEQRATWLHRARQSLDLALKRSPRRWSAWRGLAMLEDLSASDALARGDEAGAARARRAAADAWERAVALYPCDARTRIRCADAWFALWQTSRDDGQRGTAARHYAAALAFDDVYPPQEVKRLSPAQRAHVRERVAQLD